MSISEETAAVRLWAKVNKNGPIIRPELGHCWIFEGKRHRFGYGMLSMGRKKEITTHRLAYQLKHGPIPDGVGVLHHCDNPPCVRDEHLYLGTQLDNSRDMFSRGRARPGWVKGVENGNAKLTDAKVLEIRARVAAGERYKALATEYGVSDKLIGMVARRAVWKHIP